ncbi:MAG TPA: O-antigen ligase family protein [Candidatus Limnocylindria bacterium]|jgi:O-antigen ligase|nr:O-antigen ligase family protein [Candidatus Limnocylindria bacterium]
MTLMLPRRGHRRTVVLIAIALTVAIPFVGTVALAPSQGIRPLIGMGLLVGPVAAGLWFAFRRPVIAIVTVFVGLAPVDFLLSIGNGTSATRLIGLAAAAALVLGLCARGSSGRIPGSVIAWLVAYAYMSATLIWAGDQPKSIERLESTGLSLLLVALVAVTKLDRIDLTALLLAVVGGGFGVSVYMLVTQAHFPGYAAARVYLTNGQQGIDPNGVAFALMPPLAIALGAAMGPGNRWRRILASAIIPVFVIAILETESRGGLVGATLMILWMALRSRQRAVAAAIIGLVGVLAFLENGVFSRFNDPEGAGRTSIWKVGVEAFRHHWLIGNGYGTFSDAYNQVYLFVPHTFHSGWSREAHDLIISSFVELGVVGGSLVLYAFWRQFRELRTIPLDDPDAWLRLMAEGGILAVFVVAIFLDILPLKPAWVLPIIIGAVATIRAREHAPTGLSYQDFGPDGRSAPVVTAGRLRA